MVRQINGVYKVKSPDLQTLFREAKALISKLKAFSMYHVPREQNREAERLANLAMDGAQAKGPARESPPRSLRTLAVYREGSSTRLSLSISLKTLKSSYRSRSPKGIEEFSRVTTHPIITSRSTPRRSISNSMLTIGGRARYQFTPCSCADPILPRTSEFSQGQTG